MSLLSPSIFLPVFLQPFIPRLSSLLPDAHIDLCLLEDLRTGRLKSVEVLHLLFPSSFPLFCFSLWSLQYWRHPRSWTPSCDIRHVTFPWRRVKLKLALLWRVTKGQRGVTSLNYSLSLSCSLSLCLCHTQAHTHTHKHTHTHTHTCRRGLAAESSRGFCCQAAPIW